MTTTSCFRSAVVSALFAVVLTAGPGTSSVFADTLACSVDGYSAMGGMIYYTDSNQYLLAGNPASPPSGAMETWGYAWLKFGDLPTEAIGSATLILQSIAQTYGGMYQIPENAPVHLAVYAATSDVAALTNSSANQAAFRSSLIGAAPVDTVYVTGGNGFYELNVTSIVNGWIDSGNNYGLVIASLGNAIPRFHSRETLTGTAPTIVTSAVPEPGTATLAAAVLVGLGFLRVFRRRSMAARIA